MTPVPVGPLKLLGMHLAAPGRVAPSWGRRKHLGYSVLRHANNLESVLTYQGTSERHTLVMVRP
jgi:hypothetical protein